ncbi:MAG: GtrA family protein [Alphaproteobacteria bacterium]|nr:GtrA family protein [Alphaproteobacteria bacterium]
MMRSVKIIKQFSKFCGVGAINTVVSLIIIFILSEVFNTHFITANIFGYLVGVILGFVLHKTLTFKDTSKETKKQFMQFLGVFFVTYILQLSALTFFINILGLFEFASQILAAGVYTLLNFIGNLFFTFKQTNTKKTS